jgi:hypothetical protein
MKQTFIGSQALWHTVTVPALGRLRQEDHKFVVSLGYVVRPCPRKINRKTKK